MAVIIRHEYPDVVVPWLAERLPATLPWGWELLWKTEGVDTLTFA